MAEDTVPPPNDDRKVSRILSIVVLTLAGAFVILNLTFTTEMEYRNLSRTEAQELVEKGWIPPILCPHADRVSMQYDLDTNEGGGQFHFPARDSEDLLRLLRQFSVTPPKPEITTASRILKATVMHPTHRTNIAVEVDWQAGHVKFQY